VRAQNEKKQNNVERPVRTSGGNTRSKTSRRGSIRSERRRWATEDPRADVTVNGAQPVSLDFAMQKG